MIEGWMISLLIAIITLVASYAVMKSNVAKSAKTIDTLVNENKVLNDFMTSKAPLLNHLSKKENFVDGKIEEMGKEIVEIRTQMAQVPTMKNVRDEFVSKELFRQMEKHMDEKFDGLQVMLMKVLANQERMDSKLTQ